MKVSSHSPVAQVFFALGQIEFTAGNLKEARNWLESAVSESPGYSDALILLGRVNLATNELEEASHCYDCVLELDANSFDALCGLARLAAIERQFNKASDYWSRASSIEPLDGESLAEWAKCLEKLDHIDEALDCWELALRLAPDDPGILNNVGLLNLVALGNIEIAKKHLSKAVQIQPGQLGSQLNLFQVQADAGDLAGAIDSFSRLINSPERDNALLHRALALLRVGRFNEGWMHYGARWRRPGVASRPFDFSEWSGGPIPGEQLLVYAEQGLGDEIMFASCLPDLLANLQGNVILECDPKLGDLFQRSFHGLRVVAQPRTLQPPAWLESFGKIGFQIAIGDLPALYRSDWSDFPLHQGYLRVDPTKLAHWQSRLNSLGEGPKLGISWRGGKSATRSRVRSTKLKDWMPILKLAGWHFVSLQYDDCDAEIHDLQDQTGCVVHHWPEAIADYDQTAALVAALDGVMTVCTAIAHLTGALGRPGCVLVPSIPEWRYLQVGNKMPWYPSLQLVRQAPGQAWPDLLSAMAEVLRVEHPSVAGV